MMECIFTLHINHCHYRPVSVLKFNIISILIVIVYITLQGQLSNTKCTLLLFVARGGGGGGMPHNDRLGSILAKNKHDRVSGKLTWN